MSTVVVPKVERLVLNDVDWRTYQRLLRALDERPALRLTYDRGTLELMTISFEHELHNRFLSRLVVVLTEELDMPLKEGGTTTLRRRRRKRGLEPDSCFWIANEDKVRLKVRIDLRTDPPPDLAIEADVSHSSLNRMAIYAALGVPEVWRYDGQTLTFHILGADGRYVAGPSRAFPTLLPDEITVFLPLRQQLDDNAVVRQFRAWVRQRYGTGGGSAPPTP
jgi:Uma2 family endonuclease